MRLDGLLPHSLMPCIPFHSVPPTKWQIKSAEYNSSATARLPLLHRSASDRRMIALLSAKVEFGRVEQPTRLAAMKVMQTTRRVFMRRDYSESLTASFPAFALPRRIVSMGIVSVLSASRSRDRKTEEDEHADHQQSQLNRLQHARSSALPQTTFAIIAARSAVLLGRYSSTIDSCAACAPSP